MKTPRASRSIKLSYFESGRHSILECIQSVTLAEYEKIISVHLIQLFIPNMGFPLPCTHKPQHTKIKYNRNLIFLSPALLKYK